VKDRTRKEIKLDQLTAQLGAKHGFIPDECELYGVGLRGCLGLKVVDGDRVLRFDIEDIKGELASMARRDFGWTPVEINHATLLDSGSDEKLAVIWRDNTKHPEDDVPPPDVEVRCDRPMPWAAIVVWVLVMAFTAGVILALPLS
jgi:hypothetical protein